MATGKKKKTTKKKKAAPAPAPQAQQPSPVDELAAALREQAAAAEEQAAAAAAQVAEAERAREEATAAAEAQRAAAEAERAAAEKERNTSAAREIANMYSAYGMQDLADWIVASAVEGKNAQQLAVEVYDQPAYKKYFPAMDALRKKGHAITEAQYRQVEQGYRDVLSYAGLAGSVFDSTETFTRLMESEVSARELEERVADAKMVTDSTDPNVKRALREYYGITESDLVSYALDPQGRGKDHVERLARSATLRGIADTTRLNLSAQYAEGLANDSLFDNAKEADYREALAKVSMVNEVQTRLASLEGDTFTGDDAADVALKGNATKTLASRRRAEREAARFSGSVGLSSGSLRRGSL